MFKNFVSRNFQKILGAAYLHSQDTFVMRKIGVGNLKINYLKVGTGSHSVLCLPGSLGSIWTDFREQINGLDLRKYTLVVWDPPGYGLSRPPERDFSLGYLERDADIASELMNVLDMTYYSILGWSDGGITGLFMTAKYQQNVKKLVSWGANAYFTVEDLNAYERIRDISNWSPSMRVKLEEIYGPDRLKEMMNQWVDSVIAVLEKENGDLCRGVLPKINAPTLIPHGDKDPLVPSFHPEYIKNNIKNAKLYIFKDGKHNIHIKYADEFNKLVQEFLDD